MQRIGGGGLALSVGGGLTTLLAACGDSDSPSTASVAGSGGAAALKNLTISFEASAPTLDIATAFVGNISTMMLLIHEPLVTYDNDLKLIGHLAESWSQPNELEYVFKLRQGVTFWDGSPLTVDDVVYSLARNLDPKFASQIAGYFTNVKSVKAAGANAVSVKLAASDETFPYILTLAGMVKKSVAEPRGNHYAQPGTEIVGTGPFVVKHYVADQGIELTRYEDYWGKKPAIESISVKVIPDQTSRQLAMRSGATIMSYDVSIDQLKTWSQIPDVKVPVAPGLEISYLSFDLSQAPWNDIHVRRAFSYCWDDKFVSAVMGEAASPASAIVPTGMWANSLDAAGVEQLYATLPKRTFDIDKAKAELAQSSVPNGFSAKVVTPNTAPQLQKAMLSLKQNLASIGIKLDVVSQPQPAWKAYQDAHRNLGLQVHETGPDYPDPADYYSILYLSKNATANNSNLANYKDPAFDRLFAQQAGETDKAKRAELLSKMLQMAEESQAYLPFWWTGFAIAYRPDKMKYDTLTSLCYLQSWTANITPA